MSLDMSGTTFLLVGNGSYLNRGCEAIVRGTVKILRATFDSPKFVNANFDVMDPPFIPEESDPDIIHRPLPIVRRGSARWVVAQMADRFYPPLGRHVRFARLKEEMGRARAVLSIGGDNYTLDYGLPHLFVRLDKYLIEHRVPLFIWGASVGPFEKRPDFAKMMLAHLKQEVLAIFVRERLSRDYLADHGLEDKVYLMPDPAFLMDRNPVRPERIGIDIPSGTAIGLNVSPLMERYATIGASLSLRDTTVEIVKALRRRFGKPILLIPHVTSPHSNDHAFLMSVARSFDGKQDVFCLPANLTAPETKWIISQLCCLIASRTHAAIAGFSSGIPTVSLAYSRKAYGINDSLFGNADYVIAPGDLTPAQVVERTCLALEQTGSIKRCLQVFMRTVYQQTMFAGQALRKLLTKRQ